MAGVPIGSNRRKALSGQHHTRGGHICNSRGGTHCWTLGWCFLACGPGFYYSYDCLQENFLRNNFESLSTPRSFSNTLETIEKEMQERSNDSLHSVHPRLSISSRFLSRSQHQQQGQPQQQQQQQQPGKMHLNGPGKMTHNSQLAVSGWHHKNV